MPPKLNYEQKLSIDFGVTQRSLLSHPRPIDSERLVHTMSSAISRSHTYTRAVFVYIHRTSMTICIRARKNTKRKKESKKEQKFIKNIELRCPIGTFE